MLTVTVHGYSTFDIRACHAKGQPVLVGTVSIEKNETLSRLLTREGIRHNVLNALAAIALADSLKIAPETIRRGLMNFSGTDRRFQYKGEVNGFTIIDDYAHHPSAIAATLAGARELGYRRVLCAYQPHTYSRTAGLFEEFTHAFDLADEVYFAEIYAARETNESGISSADLARAIGSRAKFCGNVAVLALRLPDVVRDGDLLLVMGAGDIENVFDTLPLKKE